MHTLDRIRDACVALGIPDPGLKIVTLVDLNFDFEGRYHGHLLEDLAKKRERKRAEAEEAAETRSTTGDLGADGSAVGDAAEVENDDEIGHEGENRNRDENDEDGGEEVADLELEGAQGDEEDINNRGSPHKRQAVEDGLIMGNGV